MNKSPKHHEKFLCEIWKSQTFLKELTTSDGDKITIIDAGQENKETGGPDFKNARIKIGNITFCGDVEIDSFHSDWRNHGHNINKKYNKVILHAVLNNNTNHPFVFTQEGRKVQSISIEEFLKEDLRKDIQKAIASEQTQRMNKMPCLELNEILSEKEKVDYLHDLGIERFRKKSQKMLERLKEIIYVKELKIKEPIVKYELDEKFYNRAFSIQDYSDKEAWQQLIYEEIFEALGYSKNKEIMLRLAKSLDISFYKKFANKDNLINYIEASLFSVAGLMPDIYKLPDEDTSAYVKKLTENWNEVKEKYDGKIYHSSQWHFFKLRPQNFPTIRLSGGARILNKIIKGNLFSELVQLVESGTIISKLCNDLRSHFIIKGDGFWKKHYVFDQPAKNEINYFIGLSRADEIIVNVVLPILAVYFEIFQKRELSKKTIKIYQNYYQKSENSLVDEISSGLKINGANNRSILYQGMIELFRSYCSRDKCLECLIGKKVFN